MTKLKKLQKKPNEAYYRKKTPEQMFVDYIMHYNDRLRRDEIREMVRCLYENGFTELLIEEILTDKTLFIGDNLLPSGAKWIHKLIRAIKRVKEEGKIVNGPIKPITTLRQKSFVFAKWFKRCYKEEFKIEGKDNG